MLYEGHSKWYLFSKSAESHMNKRNSWNQRHHSSYDSFLLRFLFDRCRLILFKNPKEKLECPCRAATDGYFFYFNWHYFLKTKIFSTHFDNICNRNTFEFYIIKLLMKKRNKNNLMCLYCRKSNLYRWIKQFFANAIKEVYWDDTIVLCSFSPFTSN